MKNLLAAERHLRGSRPALLRPDRRPRHPAAHPHLRISQDAERAGAAAHPHAKRQGLRARAREAGQVSRPRQIRARDRRDRGRADADLFASFSARRSRNSPTRISKIVAITGAMPTGTGLVYFRRRTSRPLLRRRHRRGTRRALRLRPRDAGLQAVPRRSTPPSCSAPTT